MGSLTSSNGDITKTVNREWFSIIYFKWCENNTGGERERNNTTWRFGVQGELGMR